MWHWNAIAMFSKWKIAWYFLTFNVKQFILKLELFFTSQSMPAVRRAGNSQATGLSVLNFIYQFGGGTGFQANVGFFWPVIS